MPLRELLLLVAIVVLGSAAAAIPTYIENNEKEKLHRWDAAYRAGDMKAFKKATEARQCWWCF